MRALGNSLLAMGLISLSALQTAAAVGRCEGLAPDAKTRTAQQLDEAEMALELGDLELANLRLNEASRPSAVVDIALDQECMGQELRARYYRVKQRVTLATGKAEEASGRRNAFGSALNAYIDGDNRTDVTRMLNGLPSDSRTAASTGNFMRRKLERLQYSIDKGHGLIPEEQSAPDFYRAALDNLIKRSRSEADKLLRAEEQKVTGPVTDREKQLGGAQDTMAALQESFLGETTPEFDNAAAIAALRASESLEMLGKAQDWLSWIGEGNDAPAIARADKRGDAILEKADDQSNSLEARDEYYDAAIRYYRFAKLDTKLAGAEQSRNAIQAALLAEREQREQRMEAKADQLEREAVEFRKSMEMSAEEKDAFESEADALEAELGF